MDVPASWSSSDSSLSLVVVLRCLRFVVKRDFDGRLLSRLHRFVLLHPQVRSRCVRRALLSPRTLASPIQLYLLRYKPCN